mmetsp:Transcript_3150/g.4596  ORF Transcript_3150/g.4596 Transcript_3150/m.4596 type:complete len:247 (+) Transcript_3150:134-874(+)
MQTTTLDIVMQRYYERQRVMGTHASPEIHCSTSCLPKSNSSDDERTPPNKDKSDVGLSSPTTSSTDVNGFITIDTTTIHKPEETVPRKTQNTDETEDRPDTAAPHTTGIDYIRKSAVAIAGGSLVGIGAVLVPLPIPAGIFTMGVGMAVLGTEFPQAQQALDTAVDKIADILESTEEKKDDVDGEELSEVSMSGLEGASNAFKKQAERIGQRVLPLIRPKSSTVELPGSGSFQGKEELPPSVVELS